MSAPAKKKPAPGAAPDRWKHVDAGMLRKTLNEHKAPHLVEVFVVFGVRPRTGHLIFVKSSKTEIMRSLKGMRSREALFLVKHIQTDATYWGCPEGEKEKRTLPRFIHSYYVREA